MVALSCRAVEACKHGIKHVTITTLSWMSMTQPGWLNAF